MPNHRGTTIEPLELEQAKPFQPGRFAEAEPQQDRGGTGSRGVGSPISSQVRDSDATGSPSRRKGPAGWSGVNPLPPIDPSMPLLAPGDQGG